MCLTTSPGRRSLQKSATCLFVFADLCVCLLCFVYFVCLAYVVYLLRPLQKTATWRRPTSGVYK